MTEQQLDQLFNDAGFKVRDLASQKQFLEDLGFVEVYDQEAIKKMIFHRPPALQVNSIMLREDILYGVYFPPPEIFEGHAMRGFGPIHPGWFMGEYACQAGLVFALLSKEFADDPELEGYKAIPIATLHQGEVRFWQRPVRPDDIVLFRANSFGISKDEKLRGSWRMISGTVAASVSNPSIEELTEDVAEYDIRGVVRFQRNPLI